MADKPQDHKRKRARTLSELEDFHWEYQGEAFTITVKEMKELVTPGWFRRHRNLDEMGATFALVEQLDKDDLIRLLDDDWAAMRSFSKDFGPFTSEIIELSLGKR